MRAFTFKVLLPPPTNSLNPIQTRNQKRINSYVGFCIFGVRESEGLLLDRYLHAVLSATSPHLLVGLIFAC